jgi:hypothetical protein
VSWRGGSQEVAKLTGTAWLKDEGSLQDLSVQTYIFKEYENMCNNTYKKSKITKHKYKQTPRVGLQYEIIKQKWLARKMKAPNI